MGMSTDFEDAAFALWQSWETHRQAFGPILEPAFEENQEARVLLIDALNHISRREVKQGMELLKKLAPFCAYDEDRAAWAFFTGLCFEMAGAREQMLQWYQRAGEIGHRFYLPYLKLAKAAHASARFKEAKGYYETAVDCLLEMPDQDRDERMLGSAYTNLTLLPYHAPPIFCCGGCLERGTKVHLAAWGRCSGRYSVCGDGRCGKGGRTHGAP